MNEGHVPITTTQTIMWSLLYEIQKYKKAEKGENTLSMGRKLQGISVMDTHPRIGGCGHVQMISLYTLDDSDTQHSRFSI